MNLTNLTINQAHQGLIKKQFSANELARGYLDKIKKKDKEICAFLTVTEELALSQAKKIDDLIAKGKEISVLAGIPLAIKDNILVDGVKSTAGSKILQDYIAPYDATVIKKLKQEKVLILGKTNLDEFAMGSSCENSAFKLTKNPCDLSCVPGGSSGGSAAAVASDECICALGSDTGGSIRQPACFCGVVGLKPTYGVVSRYGLIAFASSLDQIGPITKTIEDCQIVFDAIKGKDLLDSTSVENPKIQNTEYKIQNLKIGVPKEYFIKGMDTEVEKVIKSAIKKYEKLGAKIIEISLPHTEYALACYYMISTSEASANLARYDGIRYGYSEAKSEKRKAKNLLDVYLQTREQGFGSEVKRRIMLGTYALSAGYYDAYYKRSQKVRTLIQKDFENAFKRVDVIFCPVSPTPAFKIAEKIADPLKMYLSDIFTISVNLAGLPALSLPVGKVGNLPIGLQIIGKPFDEDKILQTGLIFENLCQK
ncbi:Asp-tRNA(Asn)/Glu-tRNA(Gln) amidotransferase subunit GatA [Candidatus Parcubacteria bacterium]|nr:Asp-tRNA(Asn)/Glu-tRNA(Gln) amidotransferase subunit GatA [Candidatus Parcubacteria bacterium]